MVKGKKKGMGVHAPKSSTLQKALRAGKKGKYPIKAKQTSTFQKALK